MMGDAVLDRDGTAERQQMQLGKRVVISHLAKRYRDTPALDDVSLDIEAGELVSILGPSGSGKTTALMIIAGFAQGAYDGQVLVGGHRIDNLPPNHRGIGVVFQHLELFPHMTVEDNVAFPLRMRGMPAAAVRERVEATLALVRLAGFGKRLPAQLSGGQRQRVALARAVVYSPPVLLLDEPFGALDKALREDMQAELRSLNRTLGITVINVTHDQAEALAISDRIVVMNQGRVEQTGTPNQIWFEPASAFVAGFVGESVFVSGKVHAVREDGHYEFVSDDGLACTCRALRSIAPGTPVSLMVRPDHVRIATAPSAAAGTLRGRVAGSTFAGSRITYVIDIGRTSRVKASVPHAGADDTLLRPGDEVAVGWEIEDALLVC
ncbi:ABC transporter ATP-binding protein [Burkholderia multivorans]|nr:ABC transporter ATP-binding protein [Burkholderia multivorans]